MNSKWILKSGCGAIENNDFRLRIDCQQPQSGFEIETRSQTSGDCSVGNFFKIKNAKVDPERESIENYVRGSDLIARYESGQRRSIGFECYWRWQSHDQRTVSIEFMYSLETTRLDEQIAAEIESDFLGQVHEEFVLSSTRDDNLIRKDNDVADDNAIRFESGDVHGLLVVFPNDHHRLDQTQSDAGQQITFGLKPGFLEKGVIRRLRMISIFSLEPAADLLAIGQQFVESELPLTV